MLKGIQWQSQEDRQVWVCFYLACGHLVDNSRQAPPGPRRLGPDPSADREGRPVSPRAAGAGKGRGLRRGEKSVRVLCDPRGLKGLGAALPRAGGAGGAGLVSAQATPSRGPASRIQGCPAPAPLPCSLARRPRPLHPGLRAPSPAPASRPCAPSQTGRTCLKARTTRTARL